TELYDYFRLLWARCGTLHCPTCGCELERATSSTIVDALLRSKGRILTVLAPLDTTQPLSELLAQLRREGFRRLRLDGDTATLDEVDHGASPQTLELIIDRTVTEEDNRGRLADAIELGLAKGSGTVLVDGGEGTVERFSEYTACPQCSFRLDTELTPRDFSFNSFTGACPTCHGLARVQAVSPELLIPDPRKSLRRGGIPILRDSWLEEGQWRQALLATVAGHYGFTLDTPLEGLTPQQRQVLLYGSAGEFLDVHLRRRGRSSQVSVDRSAEWEGFIPMLTRWFREDPGQYAWVERYMQESTCPDCRGERLKPVPRAVTLGGKRLPEVCALSVQQARTFFAAIRLPETQAAIAEQPLKEVRDRLGFLNDVGLGYLELDRSSATLSGGEAQRVRLATQIGSKLVGVLYVLDEPSVGLHPRDVDQLLDSLAALRDLGNTLVLVEHDAETMRRADHIIDLGPGAGRLGGQIVAAGSYGEVLRHPTSLTARYLRGELTSVLPQRRGDGARALLLHGARAHNLKNIDVRFPLSRLIAVTGVSGSGKSSLITGTLARVLEQRLRRSSVIPGAHQSLDGVEQVTGVVIIDQSPIGRSPRSNPATYSGVFESIRDFFANLPESRVRGFTPARFSFNERQGMCPACGGEGVIAIEMHFLADVTVPCEVCSGRRYNAQTLQVKYRGKSIAGVLELTIDEALEFFQNLPAASNILQVLSSVGLGYLRLGQPVNTLSRGESQRLKLAAELCRQNTGGTVYILDEPTTGLHAADVQTLLAALQRLVDRGNTVIVIEHHMDVVKVADYVIDLGPEGGERGGYLVTAGLPEAVAQCDTSRTAPFLGRALDSLAASIGALS
ncbi:MAG: excinuclease ABC subunit UvrA, partial [Chloroflexi bacterium]|nr:excinuclease ABC subunit UvrA [Chloroflexota bacterium]